MLPMAAYACRNAMHAVRHAFLDSAFGVEGTVKHPRHIALLVLDLLGA